MFMSIHVWVGDIRGVEGCSRVRGPLHAESF